MTVSVIVVTEYNTRRLNRPPIALWPQVGDRGDGHLRSVTRRCRRAAAITRVTAVR